MLLFKYLPADRVDVLESLKIRFTQSSSLNDPFELSPYFPKLLSDESVSEAMQYGVKKAYIETGCDKEMSYSQFYSLNRHLIDAVLDSFDGGLGKEKLNSIMSYLRNSVGVLSLSGNVDNLLMWSHYALSHTGFAIAFDAKHPFFSEFSPQGERQYFGLGKVEYSHKRLHLTIDELGDSKALFWKPDCWSYEDEWRFIKNFDKQPDFVVNGDDIFLFDIPPECINSVYLGANMKSDSIDKIKNLLADKNRSHIRINQMKLCEKEFALKVEALN